MITHPLLEIDMNSSIKWSQEELEEMNRWFYQASLTVEKLLSDGLIKGNTLKKIRVSLLLCGDKKIKSINSNFRNKDRVTDVLSFPSSEDLRKRWKKETIEGELFLGDMAICIPQARRQAIKFNISFWDEFIHLFFHGFFHLWGFDHEVSAKEEKLMQKWEDRALEIIGQIRKR